MASSSWTRPRSIAPSWGNGTIRKVFSHFRESEALKRNEPSRSPAELHPQLAALEFDLPSRRAARSAHAGDGDHVQRFPSPAPGGGAKVRHTFELHLVHGRRD